MLQNVLVTGRIQIPQGKVLQFPFHLLNTKTVGKGCVNIHGLPALDQLLGRALVLHSAHIVQPVSDLNQHNPDVLGHGHEHLPQILHLLLLRAGEIGTGQLGNALHQFGGSLTKEVCNLVKGGIGVLNAIVQQRTQHRIHIQAHFSHDGGNSQRMDDIGRAVLAGLLFVLFPGVLHCLINEGHIHTGHMLL